MPKKHLSLTDLHRDLDHMILTAHRGASADFPENTLCAFEHAVEAGADLIEFDLRASREGIPLVLHDATLERTTDGKGEPEHLPLADIRKLDASGGKGAGIPTFEEVLASFSTRTLMNIQIYTGTEQALAEVCRLYRAYDMYDRGYLAIGKREQLDFVRRLDPEIEIYFLPGWDTRSTPESLRLCRELGCRFVQPIKETVTADTVALCRELGLRENLFYCDDPEEAKRLFQSGVRGLLTNRIPALGSIRYFFT